MCYTFYNIMVIKSLQTLVSETLKEIKTINADEAYEMFEGNKCNLIDIREINELDNTGRVEGASHIPRGMLEFWIDPNSAYYKQGRIDGNIKRNKFKTCFLWF